MARGGMMAFTRDPSSRRASTMGDFSSILLPRGFTIRSMTARSWSSVRNLCSVRVSFPLRSTKTWSIPFTMISETSGSRSRSSSGPSPRASSRISFTSRFRRSRSVISLASSSRRLTILTSVLDRSSDFFFRSFASSMSAFLKSISSMRRRWIRIFTSRIASVRSLDSRTSSTSGDASATSRGCLARRGRDWSSRYELLAEGVECLRHRMAGGGGDERVRHGDRLLHQLLVERQVEGDRKAHALLDGLGRKGHLGAVAIQHQPHGVAGEMVRLEIGDRLPSLRHRTDVGRQDQADELAQVEDGNDVLGEGRGEIDDHVVVGPHQKVGDPGELLRGEHLFVERVLGRRDHGDSRGVVRHVALQERRLHPVEQGNDVGHRLGVGKAEVEGDASGDRIGDVEKRYRGAGLPADGDREVRGDEARAPSALYRENADSGAGHYLVLRSTIIRMSRSNPLCVFAPLRLCVRFLRARSQTDSPSFG